MPAAFVIGLALWYWIVDVLGPGAAWQKCQAAYATARTAADTTRVDRLRSFTRREVKNEECGVLRRARELSESPDVAAPRVAPAVQEGCYLATGAVGFPEGWHDVYLPERFQLRGRRSAADNHLFGYSAAMLDTPSGWRANTAGGEWHPPDSLFLHWGLVTYRFQVVSGGRLVGTAVFDLDSSSVGHIEAKPVPCGG